MYQISNQYLEVSIAAKGAELQSIYNKHTKLEYMWGGDPAFWSKKSPVLFPIVGGLKNNTYYFNKQAYSLNRHGFARDSMFEVTQQSANSITFSIASNEETRKIYPFDFHFSIIYTLQNEELIVTYAVNNTGNHELFFSVGAHPAFKVPLTEGTTFTDYYLLFNTPENIGRWPLSAEGLIEKKTIPVLQNEQELPLTKALFFSDALVFKQLRSNTISIVSHQHKHGVSITFDGFPYMGIWSAKHADFVCIEPWCGIADSVDTTQQLSDKEGILQLQPQANFQVSWKGRFF
ncbi:MAG: aldose 1-epimerase family protein [Bacteroidota bacterium]|nr:aldose 1-epimerase family protein [Bacteroidota bacterium]